MSPEACNDATSPTDPTSPRCGLLLSLRFSLNERPCSRADMELVLFLDKIVGGVNTFACEWCGRGGGYVARRSRRSNGRCREELPGGREAREKKDLFAPRVTSSGGESFPAIRELTVRSAGSSAINEERKIIRGLVGWVKRVFRLHAKS